MAIAAAFACIFAPSPVLATVVRFNTTQGNVDVRLYNSATPLNVANFLHYQSTARFNGTFIHRSVPGFVIQGGGYYYDTGTQTAPHIAEYPMVNNEFGISNLRGTIAMAKLPPPSEGGPVNGGPNSATSEWFFNLANNSSNLDNQNGGFTVFGRVVGSGMTVVDAIAGLTRYNAGGAFDNLPLTTPSIPAGLVVVNSVTVLNFQPGDYDFNGTVNAADLTVWKSSYGSTTNAAADGNGNGKVDDADYVIWRNTLGLSGGPGSGSASIVNGSVPEPTTAVLLSVAAFFFPRRRQM